MIAAGEDATRNKWTSAHCPFAIEYDTTAMDDIRLAVMDAFFSLPRGGAEIGGILLGERSGGKVVITGYEALDCEHAYGPSFTLSPNDHSKLTDLIASTPGGGQDVVGWYHSHTRSEVFLSEADVEIHNRYFREPWQIAMVMKPSAFKPARVGFFFHDGDGQMRTESAHDEFELRPQMAAPAPAPDPPAARQDRGQGRRPRQPEPEPEPERTDPPVKHHVLTLDAVLKSVESAPESLRSAAPPVQAPHEPAPAPPAAEARREPVEPLPQAERTEPVQEVAEEPSGAFGGWYWLIVACLVGVLIYQTREYWMGASRNPAPPAETAQAPAATPAKPSAHAPAPRTALGLALNDASGHLQIRWDGSATVVRESPQGSIEIADGERRALVPLTPERLRAGSFTYARETQSVDVRLIVEESGGNRIQETATFFGKLPEHPSADTEAVKQRDQLAQENARLKTALATQTERAGKLEKALEETRRQLKRDQQRRRLENQVREPD